MSASFLPLLLRESTTFSCFPAPDTESESARSGARGSHGSLTVGQWSQSSSQWLCLLRGPRNSRTASQPASQLLHWTLPGFFLSQGSHGALRLQPSVSHVAVTHPKKHNTTHTAKHAYTHIHTHTDKHLRLSPDGFDMELMRGGCDCASFVLLAAMPSEKQRVVKISAVGR